MAASEVTFKTPKYQTKIHLPEIPGSFTFRKNGKLRLDQQVKKFCLLNGCRGCFEVKVHFGIHVNPNSIKYDATSKGITIQTLNDQRHKFNLFVPFPKNLTLSIPKNPEAQLFCGKLSAKIAIVDYDKNEFKKKKKSTKQQQKDGETDTQSKDSKENRENSKKQKRKKMKKPKKMSLDELNKRIAENAVEDGTGESKEPPKKKRKWNKTKKVKQATKKKETKSNEMTMDDQHELIDGVVDKIEFKVKEKRKKENEKDADLKEYLKNRAERKQKKEQKKKDLREKFLLRRSKKKQKQRRDRKGTSFKLPLYISRTISFIFRHFWCFLVFHLGITQFKTFHLIVKKLPDLSQTLP